MIDIEDLELRRRRVDRREPKLQKRSVELDIANQQNLKKISSREPFLFFFFSFGPYVPAAFLKAVNLLALIRALTSPVISSKTIVEAGKPFCLISSGAEAEGTDTTFIAVPKGVIRDGMNKAVWFVVGTLSLCGRHIESTSLGSPLETLESLKSRGRFEDGSEFEFGEVEEEREKKTRAIRLVRSSEVKVETTLSTSELDRKRTI